MLENQRQSLLLAKELYPTSNIEELILIAQTIEKQYYTTSNLSISLIDFCQQSKIQHPIRGSINFKLYDFQKHYLNKLENNKMIVNVNARQMGTTQILSHYALWYSLCNSYTTIHVMSNTFNNAGIIRDSVKCAADFITDISFPAITRFNRSSILFSNGSEIKFLSAAEDIKILPDVLIIDNAAYIPHSIFDNFWKNNYTTLRDDHCQIIVNSGAGDTKGVFYNLFNHPADDWVQNAMPWQLHPDRTQKWADETTELIGQDNFDKQYNCKFIKP